MTRTTFRASQQTAGLLFTPVRPRPIRLQAETFSAGAIFLQFNVGNILPTRKTYGKAHFFNDLGLRPSPTYPGLFGPIRTQFSLQPSKRGEKTMETIETQKRWKTIFVEGERVIRGKFGQVAEYDDGDLDVWICTWERDPEKVEKSAKRSHRRAAFVESKGWKAANHYDDGALFIRPFQDLDKACRFIKARRRRQVTEAMRQRGRQLAQNLAARKKDPLLKGPITSKGQLNDQGPLGDTHAS